MTWLKENWPYFLAAMPVVATVIVLVANRFSDPDNDPKTPPPKWVQVALGIADVLSFIATKGKTGIAGPVNLPGVPSLEKGKEDGAA
jgi:hypothetical protein